MVSREDIPVNELEVSAGPQPPAKQPGELDAVQQVRAPDWVIVGVEDSMGFAVLVSDNMSRAQLFRKLDGYCKGWGGGRYPIIRNNLVMEFEEFTMIRGDSYAACLQTLATRWQPPERGHDAIADH